MIFSKGILFKTKSEFDCEFIMAPTKNFDKNLYVNLRIFLRFLISLPFAYYLGNFIYYYTTSINTGDIKQLINYLVSLTVIFVSSFYLLQIPHEIIHYFIYSDFTKNTDVSMKVLNRKRLITTVLNSKIKLYKIVLGLISPIILITIVLSTLLYIYGYNYIILSILLSNLILSTEDIINILIIIFSHKDNIGLFEISNEIQNFIDNNENNIIYNDIESITKE